MDIGIIGAGHIGSALAQAFIRAGHRVAIANSRGPQTLGELVDRLGPQAQAMTAEAAAAFGELIVETVPYAKVPDLAALPLAGKIVIDTANYYPQRDGQMDLGGRSQGGWVAQQLPGARVVKAFNSIAATDLASLGDTTQPLDERRAIFVAGDDQEAKQVVSGLIEEIGFAPVDSGSLADSAVHENGGPLYGKKFSASEARAALKQG
jgi:8-hydroxy-5-deazaflavin:NADPH oxidoreductase